MPVLAFARHAAWLSCGVYGSVTLPATVLVVAWLWREVRRHKRARSRHFVLVPLSMTDAEFEAAHIRLLRDAEDAA